MRMGKYIQHTDGEVIFEEGSIGEEVYFIVSGRVEVSQRIGAQKMVIAIFEKGDFFGEMAPLTGDVRSMTVTAAGDVYLWKLSLDEMLRYMQSNFHIMKDAYVRLAKRLSDTNLRVRGLTLRAVASDKEDHQEEMADILVVDDEVSNLNALKRFLKREYDVFSATNGEDALAIMEQESIALVIADYRMPGMTGVELLEKVRQKYPNTIRVILTAYADENLLMDAVNIVNAHGFITKPWEPEEIESIVGKWITNHSEDQQKLLEGKRRRGLSFWGRRMFGQGEPVREMKDEDKTKEQFIDELVEMRQQMAELRREAAEKKK